MIMITIEIIQVETLPGGMEATSSNIILVSSNINYDNYDVEVLLRASKATSSPNRCSCSGD